MGNRGRYRDRGGGTGGNLGTGVNIGDRELGSRVRRYRDRRGGTGINIGTGLNIVVREVGNRGKYWGQGGEKQGQI